jgi:CubicO group peptidase (beta-lactamase class C family)
MSRSASALPRGALAAPLALATALAAACGPEPPDLRDLNDEAFTQHLHATIPLWMESHGVSGAGILLLREGETVWLEAFGWADREADRPLTTASPMMTHSISKSVTAWGVMTLVQDGRIGLDDPIGRHLRRWSFPESPFDADAVTVRQLLSHSAGVPLGALGVHLHPGDEIPSLPEALSAEDARLMWEPGSAFAYSNLGYAILELLVEDVTGRPFHEFMRDQVLLPLGMRDSGFTWEEERHGDMPMGYDLRGRPVPPFVYPTRASGGLLSTLEDVGRFVAAGMDSPGGGPGSPVLTPQSVEEVHAHQEPISGLFSFVAESYGLGVFVETVGQGRKAVWHGGQGLGWMTHFHAVPETGDGIVILTNSQRSWPFMALVLADWARWRGLEPVGMARITTAATGMNLLVALVILTFGWRGWRVGRGIITGRRRLGLSLRKGSRPRFRDLLLGTAILLALRWAVTREYLFLTSLFPTAAVWLGYSSLALGLLLLVSGLFPRQNQRSPRERRPPEAGTAGEGEEATP